VGVALDKGIKPPDELIVLTKRPAGNGVDVNDLLNAKTVKCGLKKLEVSRL
jgi:hypothetical protein